MILREIIPKEQGHYIHRYNLSYTLEDGSDKIYEIISRKKDLHMTGELGGTKPNAVVVIATDASGEKILLNKEFRMAVNEWVYSFPAGLIESGESYLECARRELREETGLELYEVEDYIKESYSAVSFGNEKNVCIVGKAKGEFRASSSPSEEIICGFYNKSEVQKLLRTAAFAARTQAYCYLWSKMSY